jgi:hypothetical protein
VVLLTFFVEPSVVALCGMWGSETRLERFAAGVQARFPSALAGRQGWVSFELARVASWNVVHRSFQICRVRTDGETNDILYLVCSDVVHPS